jgi:hypothetical protein
MESGEISSMYFSMLAGGEYFDGFAEDLESFQWLQPVGPFGCWGGRAFFDATSLTRLALQIIENEPLAMERSMHEAFGQPAVKFSIYE